MKGLEEAVRTFMEAGGIYPLLIYGVHGPDVKWYYSMASTDPQ